MFINNNDISYILTDVTKDKDSMYKVCTRITNTQGYVCSNGNRSDGIVSKYVILRLNKIVMDNIDEFVSSQSTKQRKSFSTTVNVKDNSCLTYSFTDKDWNYISRCLCGSYLLTTSNRDIHIDLNTRTQRTD